MKRNVWKLPVKTESYFTIVFDGDLTIDEAVDKFIKGEYEDIYEIEDDLIAIDYIRLNKQSEDDKNE